MRDQAGLGRTHIGRGHDQRGIGAERGGAAGLLDGLGGVRQAGAGQHRDAPGDAFDRDAQQGVVFGVVQRGRLAGRAGHDDGLGAALELLVEQALPGVEIEFAGRGERRRQRGDAAGKRKLRVLRAEFNAARPVRAHGRIGRRGSPSRMRAAMLLAARKQRASMLAAAPGSPLDGPPFSIPSSTLPEQTPP